MRPSSECASSRHLAWRQVGVSTFNSPLPWKSTAFSQRAHQVGTAPRDYDRHKKTSPGNITFHQAVPREAIIPGGIMVRRTSTRTWTPAGGAWSGFRAGARGKKGAQDPALIADLSAIPAVFCPCGTSRRAFVGGGNTPCSVHRVEISRDAKPHYHKRLTEIDDFFEGEGRLELDGVLHPVRPDMAVLIRPGTRHGTVVGSGSMTILNVVVPRSTRVTSGSIRRTPSGFFHISQTAHGGSSCRTCSHYSTCAA